MRDSVFLNLCIFHRNVVQHYYHLCACAESQFLDRKREDRQIS